MWSSVLSKTGSTTYVRFNGKYDKPDLKHEAKVAKEKLEATPETVSSTSSLHGLGSNRQPASSVAAPEERLHTHGGIKDDLKTIRDTFDLSEVPREAYVLGLAGLLPYLATSFSTLALAKEINTAHEFGTGYLMNAQTAEQFLHLLEPIQVGYGAVIISFLGAIHWGFEWAGYGGRKGYARYVPGVVAPAVAWPSLLLPIQYSLIAQFLAFNYLYYTDSRAARRGWAPPWYGTYRFVLTFIVGATIVLTLIGRGELIGKIGGLPSPADRARNLQADMQERFRAEEQARRLKLIASGEASEETQESLDEGEDESEDAGKDEKKSKDDEKSEDDDSKDDEKSKGEEKKEKADDKEKDEAKKEKEE